MAEEDTLTIIPPRVVTGLKLLVGLPESQLHSVGDIVSRQAPSLGTKELVSTITKDGSLASEDAAAIVSLLWELASVQRRMDLSAEDFINKVTMKLESRTEDEWNADCRNRWTEVRQVLIRLLTSGCVAISVKAGDLLFAQNQILHESRIITDLRPVLDPSGAEIETIVPFHTLILYCIENGTRKDYHIALDLGDVKKLRKQLDRAEMKEVTLRTKLSSMGVTVIDTGT